MNLSTLFNLYESDKKIEGYSPHTLKAYRIQLNLLIRHFGDIDIKYLTTNDLKAYLAKDADRLKPSSISHRVRFLKSLFTYAHNEGHLHINLGSKLKEPKEEKRVPIINADFVLSIYIMVLKFLKEEELELLRDACKSPLERSLIELFYSTGCRIGEIHRLNRNHINWENRSIIVYGKGNKEREVYFDVRCAIWLKRYLKQRKDTDIALFATERKPYRRMSIAQMRYIIKRIAKRANLETNVYPHLFRHNFAIHLLNNNAPLELIQSYLGHSKIETTKIYAQLSSERRRELYRRYF